MGNLALELLSPAELEDYERAYERWADETAAYEEAGREAEAQAEEREMRIQLANIGGDADEQPPF